MKRFFLLGLLVAGTVFAQPTTSEEVTPPDFAEIDGCQAGRSAPLFSGPVAVGFYEADVATGRRTCPRSELGLGGRAQLVVDTPDFYGNIVGTALLFGSYALDPRTEVFGTLEAFNYDWVQNASLQGSSGTLGQLTAGATRVMYRRGSFLLAPTARVMLPTALNTQARVFGAELGVAANALARPNFALHGYLGGDASLGFSAAPAYLHGGALLNLGAEYDFFTAFGVALDVNGHFGRRGAVDYVAPALGLRFRIARVGLELAATLPLFGKDRHDIAASLKGAYTF